MVTRYGKFIDAKTGGEIGVMDMDSLMVSATEFAKTTNRVVEIVPQCVGCGEFYREVKEYKPGFCCSTCYIKVNGHEVEPV